MTELAPPALEVENLEVSFRVRQGGWLRGRNVSLKAVDGVSFRLSSGETLALVGESGCGKSTTARAIVQLVPATAGVIRLQGERVDVLRGKVRTAARRQIQMIFQDPYASLDPRWPIWRTVTEPLEVHGLLRGPDRRVRARELLAVVGLHPSFADRYPHEFSGGQRQRVAIARALALEPDIVVCDEPVSALDVSIQAQVVNLLEDLQARLGIAYLFIAHDLGLVRHIAHRVAVMYLGQFVELAPRDELYRRPLHPYTMALLSAVPVPDPAIERTRQRIILNGDVPSPTDPPSGCRFSTRCPFVTERCRREAPPLIEAEPGHFVACHYWDSIDSAGGVARSYG